MSKNSNLVLPSKEEKATYVEQMFAHIAPTYDLVNRLMTFGLDKGWRRYVVEHVAPPSHACVLDVGTGTGDFLHILSEWVHTGIVVGLDSCLPMMQQGMTRFDEKQHISCRVVTFVGGDALNLPFLDETFDSIITGFTMRNVTDIAATFREMRRVTKRGGVMACLEVAKPRNPLLHLAHQIYFTYVVPKIGGTLSGNRRAYVYLQQSARVFPNPQVLANMMREAGWSHVQYTLLSLGAVAVHRGVK